MQNSYLKFEAKKVGKIYTVTIDLFFFKFAGSQAVHEKAPLVKSVLIAGPRGVGKKMLVHCICTETGANMFDLTAANIAGKYPGKAGLAMMLHMVFKVSHAILSKTHDAVINHALNLLIFFERTKKFSDATFFVSFVGDRKKSSNRLQKMT